jgi:phosphatidylserine decarboxylase
MGLCRKLSGRLSSGNSCERMLMSEENRTASGDKAAGNGAGRRALLPMDPQLKDIQPGGGVIIHLEQRWGAVRRVLLKTFCRGYVQRMAACRRGDFNPCPHEVLDPRDLKFHRNQGGWYWEAADDPFVWREHLPFARVGLAELLVMTLTAALVCVGAVVLAQRMSGWQQQLLWLVSGVAGVVGLLIAWFFRNPRRQIPLQPGLVISPADGKVVDIEQLPHDEYIGGPAVKIGIFLSIFNVHINRAPVAGRVIGLRYRPGKYLNALRPESARENEQLAVLLEEDHAPYRGMIVRQITGAIARRIVCWLKPGDSLQRGEQFGMIKLGSRTELVMPQEAGLQIQVRPGDKVQAGSSILARYQEASK